MSFTFDLEDYFSENDTIYSSHTPYVVDPKTLICEVEPMGPTAALTTCLLLITIFFLAITGNLIVGWVIFAHRRMLTPSDVYLFHLTIADGLMALTIPFLAVALVKGWIFGSVMCRFLTLIIEANFYTSILFLSCISVDRYLVIVRANENLKSRQRFCSWVLCVAVWALGSALSLPALFSDTATLESDPQRMICSKNFDVGSATSWRIATRLFLHIFGFFLPLAVMITCYSIIVVRLLRTRGFQKHKAMKVIISVVVAFLLLWAPYHITLMVDTALRTDLIPFDCGVRRAVTTALDATSSLALFHSCINPVLYAFVGQKFRNNMSHLVQRKVRRERSISRSTSQTSEGNGALV